MKNIDLNSLNELFELLQTEVGKDILKTNYRFKCKFIRLKKLLINVEMYSKVPQEAFMLTNQLLDQINNSKKEYDESVKKIDKRCDILFEEYPSLFFLLKEFARIDRGAVKVILEELNI